MNNVKGAAAVADKHRESDLVPVREVIPKVMQDLAERQKAAKKAEQNKDKKK